VRALGLLALVVALPVQAVEPQTDWDANLYAYAGHNQLRSDSVLNPDNRIAHLAKDSATLEVRLDLKLERDQLRLTLRPILLGRIEGDGHTGDADLSQWQLRLRASEDWDLAVGREVLNWGPAQFRSPSSPFYFDNGRGNPLRELTGVDTVKASWTPDLQTTLTLARVDDDAWLLKADRRGDDWALGLVAEKTPGQGVFLGGHGQYTLGDAWLVYAEAASSTRAHALQSNADASQPFALQDRSPRRVTTLVGAAYSFDDGQSLNLELLHDGHGYDADQTAAYFARAATAPALAGLALGHAPPLLGRDYIHLLWQSNLMQRDGYWRLMATHNLTDHGSELSGYAEREIDAATSLFVLGLVPMGDARQGFSSLLRYSVMAGIKHALP